MRTIQGPVLSACETIGKSVYNDTQVESVMQKAQNNIRCVQPVSILHESLSLQW
jgi:hypothetical protein